MTFYEMHKSSANGCKECPNRFVCKNSDAPHGKLIDCYSSVYSDVYVYEDGHTERKPNMK